MAAVWVKHSREMEAGITKLPAPIRRTRERRVRLNVHHRHAGPRHRLRVICNDVTYPAGGT